MRIFSRKKNNQKNKIDEFTDRKLKNEASNRAGNIVTGKDVLNSTYNKCSNCGNVFEKFELVYSSVVEQYIKGCPNCKKDFLETEMIPLDIDGKEN